MLSLVLAGMLQRKEKISRYTFTVSVVYDRIQKYITVLFLPVKEYIRADKEKECYAENSNLCLVLKFSEILYLSVVENLEKF